MNKNHSAAPKVNGLITLARIYNLIEIFCITIFCFYFWHLHNGQMDLHEISLNEGNRHVENAFYKSISNSEIIIKYVAELALKNSCQKKSTAEYIDTFNAQPPLHSILKRSPLKWIDGTNINKLQPFFSRMNLLKCEINSNKERKPDSFSIRSKYNTLEFGKLQRENNAAYLPVFYCIADKNCQGGGFYTEFDFSAFSNILTRMHGDYYDLLRFAIVTENGEIVTESADNYVSQHRQELVMKYLQARKVNADFREYTMISPLAVFGLGESMKMKKIKGYPYYIITLLPGYFNIGHHFIGNNLLSKNIFVILGIGAVCLLFSVLTRLLLLRPILEVSNLAARIMYGTKDVYIKNYRASELQNIAYSLHKIIEQKYQLVEARAHQDYVIKQLEAANNAKSGFIRRIQHALRTPLNHIIGSADIMAKQLSNGKNVSAEYVHIISHAGKELLNSINNIITATDVEAGSIRLDESYCEVRDIINNAILNIHPQALQNSITIDVHVEHDLTLIFVDIAKISIVLQNLLRNSIMYNRPNGMITVMAKRVAKGVIITIKDNGIGISEDDVRNISSQDSSYNLLNNTNGGLGLGLAIVHSIIHLHDMKLEIESEEGKGTEVHLIIPNIRLKHDKP